jgi:hypothetical protein
MAAMTERSIIALRPADPGDDDADLARLAELDSAPPLRAPVLLALVDGEPVAALSLADGRAVADPFRTTAGVLALLRAQAAAIDRDPHPARSLRPRARKARRLAHT